jgi:hypothetical protein
MYEYMYYHQSLNNICGPAGLNNFIDVVRYNPKFLVRY